jgi:molecular chaperone GrpE
MSDERDTDEFEEVDITEAAEEELEAASGEDLEAAIREALAAVEQGEAAAPRRSLATAGAEPGSEITRLQAELAELRERSVRTLADFDNYRKRVERERADEQRYAGLVVLRDVLEVVDNLERALTAAAEPAEVEVSEQRLRELRSGVEMIVRQMGDVLRRHGVNRVAALGEPFDPRLHQAVSRHEDVGVAEPTVSEELQAGYMMNERLLRPAMMHMAMPAEGGRRQPEPAEIASDRPGTTEP